jgi:hypothetical protein
MRNIRRSGRDRAREVREADRLADYLRGLLRSVTILPDHRVRLAPFVDLRFAEGTDVREVVSVCVSAAERLSYDRKLERSS